MTTVIEPAVWTWVAQANNGARLFQSREWFAVCEAGQEPHTHGVKIFDNKQDAVCLFAFLCWQ
jgi:hypothetical protein